MTNDEQRERDMRKAMEHMASRKLTYWGFVYNFRQWRFGKWTMTEGLIALGFFLGVTFGTPWDEGWAWCLKGFCVFALGLIHWGHWRNYNGRQA